MTSSWMLVAGFLFATMGVFVKLGSAQFGSAELAFYRSVITFVSMLGVVRVRGGSLRTRHLRMHVVRSIVGAISLMAYFHAIAELPLATAQTLNYTSPIFLAIASVAVLRERLSGRLAAAIALGFVGVALLLRPTFEQGNEAAALIGLFSGVLAAWAYLSVRTLGRMGEPDWRVVFWFGLVASVMCAAWQGATSSFHALRWDNLWVLAGMGVCGTGAQLAMTRAYRTGNTLVVGALSYSTLVFGAVATMLVWKERLAAAEWLGMLVIVASGILAMRAERKSQT
ncbi:MAG TPA: DMT family transporter [Usitatibacter sp.]|jgi:drug/metabolite transporter (DMT)-like permease|nr:DMT family transporter [Usitatibacter sp.]